MSELLHFFAPVLFYPRELSGVGKIFALLDVI